jgi:phospholipase C
MHCRKGLFATLSCALVAGSALLAATPAAARVVKLPPVARDASPGKFIKHIVVIVQEGRSLDNLFNGFCANGSACADTVSTDPVTGLPLTSESLAAPFAAADSHAAFLSEDDRGRGDGFAGDKIKCFRGAQPCNYSSLSYVPSSETTVYQQLATVDGLLSDMTFEPEQAPSLPSHLYAIAGQSGGYFGSTSSPYAISGGSGSCYTSEKVPTINLDTGNPGPKALPCVDFTTIFDLLAEKNHSWRYYTDTTRGTFTGPLDIEHLFHSPNIIIGSARFLSDVENASIADVSYVMPKDIASSDEPGRVIDAGAGPQWVASVVNAIGESPYWNNTAIVVFWSGWGGWFDHIPPSAGPHPGFEYGFRVPLIVAGGYAKTGAIDHTKRTFVSTLRLIEDTFGLGSLHTSDAYEPDDLAPMFDFGHKPHAFVPLGT